MTTGAHLEPLGTFLFTNTTQPTTTNAANATAWTCPTTQNSQDNEPGLETHHLRLKSLVFSSFFFVSFCYTNYLSDYLYRNHNDEWHHHHTRSEGQGRQRRVTTGGARDATRLRPFGIFFSIRPNSYIPL